MSIEDYFEYERVIARDHLVPWLMAHGALPETGRVLDVGCGYGGTLAALKQARPRLKATGIDLDGSMTSAGQARLDGAAQLECADFFAWSGGRYDLVLMRDVLEHVRRPEEALSRAASMLSDGGRLFVSFAPFYGPFGGHQHNASGPFAAVPWLQALPEPLFRRLLPIAGNSYKVRSELQQDMDSVLITRLSVRQFMRGVKGAGLVVRAQEAYLSRPDYRAKFGLPTLRLPSMPLCHEVLATGIEVLLSRASEG